MDPLQWGVKQMPVRVRHATLVLACALVAVSSAGAQGSFPSASQLQRTADSLGSQPDSASIRRAAAAWRSAAGAWSRTGAWRRAGAALVQAGEAEEELQRPDLARDAYRRALAFQRRSGELAGMESTYTRLGLAYRSSGESDSAITSYRAALEVSGRRDVLRPILLNDLGMEYCTIGRYDLARLLLHAAKRAAEHVGDYATRSDALNNLGLMFDDLGMPARSASNREALDSALYYYAAARRAAPPGSGFRNDPVTLNNIGVVHRRLFRLTGDTSQLRAALALYDSAGRHPDGDLAFAARLLQNRALVRADLGQTGVADSLLRAARLASQVAGDRWWEAMALTELGLLRRRAPHRDLSGATAYLDTAVSMFEEVTRESGGDATRISFADQRYILDAYDAWVLCRIAQMRRGEEDRASAAFGMLAAMERGRAAALLDLLQRARAGSSASTAREQMGRAPSPADPVSDSVLDLEGRALAERARGSAAILSYLATSDTLVVWAMDRRREPRVFTVALTRDSLAAMVRRLRRSLFVEERARGGLAAWTATAAKRMVLPELERRSRGVDENDDAFAAGDTSYRVPLRSLARSLVPKEVKALLPDSGEILVVPNGPLALLPFALLVDAVRPTSPTGHYLAVRLTPSMRVLGLLRTERARTAEREHPALVVGNPAMPTVRDIRGVERRLPPLRGAAVEAAEVSRLLGVRPLLGGAATEDSVRALLPRARIVHLATHGYAFADDARAGDSFIALAPSQPGDHRQDDGLLTVSEIVGQLPPLRADLIVLSACQTALGDLKQAEGTVGLERAFLSRGARSLLVSLWNVSDAATAELMTRFYTHWLRDRDHPTEAEALERAQEDVRTDPRHPMWQHPRFWAAFQLVGAD